jgi:hypothetical protein
MSGEGGWVQRRVNGFGRIGSNLVLDSSSRCKAFTCVQSTFACWRWVSFRPRERKTSRATANAQDGGGRFRKECRCRAAIRCTKTARGQSLHAQGSVNGASQAFSIEELSEWDQCWSLWLYSQNPNDFETNHKFQRPIAISSIAIDRETISSQCLMVRFDSKIHRMVRSVSVKRCLLMLNMYPSSELGLFSFELQKAMKLGYIIKKTYAAPGPASFGSKTIKQENRQINRRTDRQSKSWVRFRLEHRPAKGRLRAVRARSITVWIRKNERFWTEQLIRH